jgi:hypothetical protein
MVTAVNQPSSNCFANPACWFISVLCVSDQLASSTSPRCIWSIDRAAAISRREVDRSMQPNHPRGQVSTKINRCSDSIVKNRGSDSGPRTLAFYSLVVCHHDVIWRRDTSPNTKSQSSLEGHERQSYQFWCGAAPTNSVIRLRGPDRPIS